MIRQLQTYLQQEQLRLPEGLDVAAVLLLSLTGALAAIRRGYDGVGVFVLALVVGAGGGLLRDGLFLQQGPPALTLDWRYLLAVLGSCLIGWLVNHSIVRFEKVIAVLDAAGLSIYSMVGLIKAIEAGLSVPAVILVGVVNAAGGGLLRDILTREEPLMFKPGQFYVVAALGGCLLFVLLAARQSVSPHQAALMAMAMTFGLRMFAITFNWRTTSLRPRVAAPGEPGQSA